MLISMNLPVVIEAQCSILSTFCSISFQIQTRFRNRSFVKDTINSPRSQKKKHWYTQNSWNAWTQWWSWIIRKRKQLLRMSTVQSRRGMKSNTEFGPPKSNMAQNQHPSGQNRSFGTSGPKVHRKPVTSFGQPNSSVPTNHVYNQACNSYHL